MGNIKCQAITMSNKTSFDPFHALDDNGVMVLSSGCRKDARYSAHAFGDEKLTCADHLALLVDEAEGEWVGDLVPVRILPASRSRFNSLRRGGEVSIQKTNK